MVLLLISLLVFIRYAAANNPSKAIRTFHAMDRFKIIPDTEAFFILLRALCKHGNIEEAEEFMLINRKVFPLETEGFNIILNGWCNISVDVVEAKRVWRGMSNNCVTPNATSYTCMISCFSKDGNLFDSLRLYDEMKKRGWIPGLEVYNSLINVLTRENCLKEALHVIDKIKETGLRPDSSTYNAIILPLCEAHKLVEARNVWANMVREGLKPTITTYHAFIGGMNVEGTLEMLSQMREAHCGPNSHTYLLVLNKFFKLGQPGNALKMWLEIEKYELLPDSAHYAALIQGLAACGWLMKAREFYAEMRSRGFLDDPELEKLLREPLVGNKCHKGGPLQNGNEDIRIPCTKGHIRGRKVFRPMKR
uniref:Pentatricopeptide repeat-containing protein n=1 Tax=Nelumbo nucifera TaxID=4432 RepID=A0A822Y5D8_NELNU|nr:TPA_asm: hypothetical protein HUJ06_028920 [Nelumbo nucifera]